MRRASTPTKFDVLAGRYTRIAVGARGAPAGWLDLRGRRTAHRPTLQRPTARTRPTDPLLLYFTSGTTAKPKLVLHSHQSYPVGHLSTMYWIGLQPGDVHWNISSPGWAKHAWSCFFAPWNAGATSSSTTTRASTRRPRWTCWCSYKVTSLCAPPTVWRMLMQEDLAAVQTSAARAGRRRRAAQSRGDRAACSAPGASRSATASARPRPPRRSATRPASRCKPGSMGRPLPGYRVALLDADGQPARGRRDRARRSSPRPLGLMLGYQDDDRAHRRRDARRLLSHRRRRRARRRRLHHLRRPRRRRVQGVRLPHQPVRAGERADRARGRRRGGGGARRPTRCGWRCPRRSRRCCAGLRAQPRAGAVHPRVRALAAGAVQAHPHRRSSASCRRRCPARSAASSCVKAKSGVARQTSAASGSSSRRIFSGLGRATTRAPAWAETRSDDESAACASAEAPARREAVFHAAQQPRGRAGHHQIDRRPRRGRPRASDTRR